MFADQGHTSDTWNDTVANRCLDRYAVAGCLLASNVGRERLSGIHRHDLQLGLVWFAFPIVATQHIPNKHVGMRVPVIGCNDGGDLRAAGRGHSCSAGNQECSTVHRFRLCLMPRVTAHNPQPGVTARPFATAWARGTVARTLNRTKNLAGGDINAEYSSAQRVQRACFDVFPSATTLKWTQKFLGLGHGARLEDSECILAGKTGSGALFE